jgi:hypothetical protein
MFTPFLADVSAGGEPCFRLRFEGWAGRTARQSQVSSQVSQQPIGQCRGAPIEKSNKVVRAVNVSAKFRAVQNVARKSGSFACGEMPCKAHRAEFRPDCLGWPASE